MSSSMRLCTASGILLLGLGLATTADATELVTNGDFSAGDTGFSSDYTDVTGNGPGAGPFNNGEYSIGTDPSQAPDRFGDWQSFGDHTTGTGNMLIADGAPNQTPIRVWYEAGITLSASTIYNFSFSDHEVQGGTGPSADLVFEVNDVVQGSDLVLPLSGAGTSWEEDSGTITGISGPVTLSIVDLDTSGPFNDFALDDISLTGPSATPVPEPSSWALMLSALGVMALGLRICRPGYLASENAIG